MVSFSFYFFSFFLVKPPCECIIFLAAITFAFGAPSVFLISTSQFRKQVGTWEHGVVKRVTYR